MGSIECGMYKNQTQMVCVTVVHAARRTKRMPQKVERVTPWRPVQIREARSRTWRFRPRFDREIIMRCSNPGNPKSDFSELEIPLLPRCPQLAVLPNGLHTEDINGH